MYLCFITFFFIVRSFATDSRCQEFSNLDKTVTKTSEKNIVFQSLDNGKTWNDYSTGLPEDFKIGNSFLIQNSEAFLSGERGMFHRSIDSETQTWEKEDFMNEFITDIFEGHSGTYARNADGVFFQKLYDNGFWIAVFKELNDINIRTIIESKDGTMLLGTEIGIYKSSDHGKSWKRVFIEGLVTNLTSIEGVIFGNGTKGLLRSTDQGENWEWVLTNEGFIRKTGIIGDHIVAVSTGKDDTVNPDGISNGLHISKDKGKTWSHMDRSLLPVRFIFEVGTNHSPVQYIYDVEQMKGDIFYSLDAGIFRSSNGGKTWDLVLPARGNGEYYEVTVTDKSMYAVRVFNGC